MAKIAFVLFAVAVNIARGHSILNSPNSLQPVQNLYVQPSTDGKTGDLYVAATEDSGKKSQWVADNPISFLTAAHQALNFPFGSLSKDDTVLTNQKRTVVTSSPIQYTYAYPGTTKEGAAVSYPYAIPAQTAATLTTEGKKDGAEKTTPVYPQYSPFQYYYPQMMSAFTSAAFSALKEAGVSDDKANSVLAQATPSVWPQAYTYAGYPSYPVQYVMVDPSAWTKTVVSSESTTAPTAATSPASIETNKSEETKL